MRVVLTNQQQGNILNILQFSDEVFAISRIIKVVGVIILIILDITKIVSNDCLVIQ